MHAIAMTAPQTKNMHECAFTSCTLLTSREFSLHHLVDLRQVLELPCPVPGIIKPSTPPASGAIGTALAKLSALLLHERFLRSGSRKAPDCASQPTGLSCQLTGPHHNSPPDCRNHSFSLRGCANSIHFPQLAWQLHDTVTLKWNPTSQWMVRTKGLSICAQPLLRVITTPRDDLQVEGFDACAHGHR
eukprot:CAMPEP_0183453164 /NCGR_PEP_ID=MMETSP0370-20130417/120182_1 /TAXON_ID=268820 /ORGANISM="Peridinium aciculiferum, Strain PAER-2" /LENGTH=187 /DNA_ID=CAMNT_0025644535 /DNA_START=226 /DNA_END=787 /DNA_ORIENTATION=-